MARFVTGKTFGTTETVTAALLNQAVNDAAISTDSVDNSTIEVNSNALRLKDSGITTAKIADSSSKTTGVTFAKMQHISTAKVLGRASASEGDVEEAFDFKDEDDMSSNSATALASQQSIKAYVDSVTIGINQTWQAVTRVIDDTTEYTNSTAKPITVLVNARYLDVGNADDLQVYMRIKPSGGSFQTLPLIDQLGFSGYSSDTGSAIIPPGSTYKFVQGTEGPTITSFQFYELR
jgi:hypothetical protein